MNNREYLEYLRQLEETEKAKAERKAYEQAARAEQQKRKRARAAQRAKVTQDEKQGSDRNTEQTLPEESPAKRVRLLVPENKQSNVNILLSLELAKLTQVAEAAVAEPVPLFDDEGIRMLQELNKQCVEKEDEKIKTIMQRINKQEDEFSQRVEGMTVEQVEDSIKKSQENYLELQKHFSILYSFKRSEHKNLDPEKFAEYQGLFEAIPKSLFQRKYLQDFFKCFQAYFFEQLKNGMHSTEFDAYKDLLERNHNELMRLKQLILTNKKTPNAPAPDSDAREARESLLEPMLQEISPEEPVQERSSPRSFY